LQFFYNSGNSALKYLHTLKPTYIKIFLDRALAKTIFLYCHSQIARAMALFALTERLQKQFRKIVVSDCDITNLNYY